MSIITIVKCFNKSEQRNQLDRKIFKGLNNYYYNHLERIRNRYIAHDSSDYSNCEVYLGVKQSSKDFGLVPIPYHSYLLNSTYIVPILKLFELAIDHAKNKVERVEKNISSKLSALTYEQVMELEKVKFKGPNAERLDIQYYYDKIKKLYDEKVTKGIGYEFGLDDEYLQYNGDKSKYIVIDIAIMAKQYDETISLQDYIHRHERNLWANNSVKE